MLRSWTDRLQVYVGPETVSMVRLSGLIRPRMTARWNWQGEGAARDGRQPALAQLAEALRLPEWQHAAVRVTLSSRVAPLRCAPWEARLTADERASMLRHQFADLHGEAMKQAIITVAESGYGQAGIACACDPRLVESLRAMCSTHGLRLQGLRPLWMAAFNRWRREMTDGDAWMLLVEPGCLTFGLLHGGAWAGIRSQTAEAGWEDELDALLAREAFHHGVEAGTFPLFVMHPQRPSFRPVLPGRKVQVLRLSVVPGFSTEGDRDVALAMV